MTDGADGAAAGLPFWDAVLAEMDARAEDYERDGRETVRLHPGDVTPLDGEYDDRVGLSILLPDNEYDELEGLLADGGIEEYTAYRGVAGDHVTLLLALETPGSTVVLVPAYYAPEDDAVDGMFAQASADGSLTLYLRRLDGEYVEVSLDDPDLLAPPGDGD